MYFDLNQSCDVTFILNVPFLYSTENKKGRSPSLLVLDFYLNGLNK